MTLAELRKIENMKVFTESDCKPFAGELGLNADKAELVDSPLDWQRRGLQQTATGYGRKLTTSRKINFEGTLYRIYCTCYSNAGSCWFTVKGRKIYVN